MHTIAMELDKAFNDSSFMCGLDSGFGVSHFDTKSFSSFGYDSKEFMSGLLDSKDFAEHPDLRLNDLTNNYCGGLGCLSSEEISDFFTDLPDIFGCDWRTLDEALNSLQDSKDFILSTEPCTAPAVPQLTEPVSPAKVPSAVPPKKTAKRQCSSRSASKATAKSLVGLGSPYSTLDTSQKWHQYSSTLTATTAPSEPSSQSSAGSSSPASPAMSDLSRTSRSVSEESDHNTITTSVVSASTGRRVVRRQLTKNSSVDGDDEAYRKRRERNNVAVRKSREKKRMEIRTFTVQHESLRREVDMLSDENATLKRLLCKLEDGLMDVNKSKRELSELIKAHKDW